jgi:hypothetical protein
MKFREFVGEKKVKEVKKVVQTNLGPTDAEHLKTVIRENPDGTKIRRRQSVETYFGFGLSKKTLKRTFDYIKSWLIRYEIPFEAVNPYLTVYLLSNLPSVSTVIKNVKNTKRGVLYEPEGTLTVISNDENDFPRRYQVEPKENKDYLVLDYRSNDEYEKVLEQVFNDLNIDVVFRYNYVKLFEVERGILKPDFYETMMYSCPRFPNLRLGNVGLIRSKKYGNI